MKTNPTPVTVATIDVYPERTRVMNADGSHAFWADPDRAHHLVARRNVEVFRSRNGRIRALRLIDPSAERRPTTTRLGHWITSSCRESEQNPPGVWQHLPHATQSFDGNSGRPSS